MERGAKGAWIEEDWGSLRMRAALAARNIRDSMDLANRTPGIVSALFQRAAPVAPCCMRIG